MSDLPVWLSFLLVYAAAVFLLALMRKREFAQHPEKFKRYEALPRGYKLVCLFVTLPLFAAGATIHTGFFALAAVCFLVLESACVRWYRKAGLYE